MKKVFYILNLLFLTLSVFGGSVFAAQPTEYIDENGETRTLSTPPTLINNGGPLTGGWYYLDSSQKTAMSFTIGNSTSSSPVNIIINGTVTLQANSWITVPENAAVNFYGATVTSSLSITNSGANYTIGNVESGSGNGNFGIINFNSGIYTVTNTGSGVPIGSPKNSGGSVNVYQAAVVNLNKSGSGAVIGTTAENAKCTINVSGGELNCWATDSSSSKLWTHGIDVGSGSVNISDQGKILTSTNPEDLSLNIVSTGGIYGYATANNTPVTDNIWNAVAGGGITVPVFDENGDTIVDTDFLDPLTGTYWISFTILPNGNLTLGAEDSEGELRAADFLVSGVGSVVNNNGIVNINAIDQTSGGGSTIYAPVIWNNNPGSTLTINEGTSSALTVYQLNNGDSESSQQASTVNLYGTLQFGSGNVTNEFNNYSRLNVGPIGQVVNVDQYTGSQTGSGKLINNAGGTVTSENPSYYGFKYTSLLSSL